MPEGISPRVLENYAFLVEMGEFTEDTELETIAARMGVSVTHAHRVRKFYREHGFDPMELSMEISAQCTASRHDATPNAYRRGCRCPATRRAWNDYCAERKRIRSQPDYVPPPRVARRTGQPTKRDQDAARRRAAAREREAARKARHRALAIGVQRRLRALMRIGHPLHEVCEEAGISLLYGQGLSSGTYKGGTKPQTAAAIDRVYQRRQYIQGSSRHVASMARKRGHLPPAAWAAEDLDNPDAGPTWPYRAQNGRSA